jgi:hypothetical protein
MAVPINVEQEEDTVIDFGDDGNGIVMINLQLEIYVIQLIHLLYQDKAQLNKIRKFGMNIDHSWSGVCQEYIEMYNLIINKNERNKNNVISIILGGQGSRLPLTATRSKPAVPIAGKYRLVDIHFELYEFRNQKNIRFNSLIRLLNAHIKKNTYTSMLFKLC